MGIVQDRHRKTAEEWWKSKGEDLRDLGDMRPHDVYAQALADQEEKTEAQIVAMLEVEIEKCSELLNRKGLDQDKRIQQENYQDSMYWTIDAIDSGDHRDG